MSKQGNRFALRCRTAAAALTAWILTVPLPVLAEGMRPIRGPVDPSFLEENGYWLLPTVAASVALVWFFFWLGMKLRRRTPVLSPLQIAQREIEEIRALQSKGETGEIPPRLSRVLREYIEAKTALRASEQTREEFLGKIDSVTDHPIPSTLLPSLREFFEVSDEAKFARRNLSEEEMDRLRDIVMETIQNLEEPTGEKR